MTTALTRLRQLAACDPGAPALSDGRAWCSRADLLARVDAVPPHTSPAVAVSAADACAGLVALLAAERDRSVPVVADPAWPAQSRDELVAAATRRRPGARGEPLITVLTSGSAGQPRAVVRTAASWAASLRSFDVVTRVRDGDVIWAPGSLSSTLTLFAGWHALATGRALVAGRWRGVESTAHAADVTVVHAVPAVVSDVLDHSAAGRLPRLRLAVVAGAHAPAALRTAAATAGVRLVEYYGAAELSFVATDTDGRGLHPFPGCRVELRDDHGRPVPAWTDGEIWVSSPYLAQGYLSDGEGPFRRDGAWATVGDRGRMRPDGSLQVVGRGGAAVVVGGHTVPVDDVEAVLREVPGVLEVACVGEPHPSLGHRLVAAVRAAPGEDPRPRLRAVARAALPHAARPSRWVLLDELPRTAAGKLCRQELCELLTRDRTL